MVNNVEFIGRIFSGKKQSAPEDFYAVFSYKNLPIAIMILDDQKVIHCNPATMRLYGAKIPSEIIGQPPGHLSPEFQPDGRRSQDAGAEYMSKIIEKGEVTFEWMLRRIDTGQAMAVRVSSVTTTLDGHPVVLTCLQDISDVVTLREENKQRSLAIANQFEAQITGVVHGVANASSEMAATAQSLSLMAEQTSHQATTVAAASEQATTNVQTVASAAEELNASIREISRQVNTAAQVSNEAMVQAETTNQIITGLVHSSNQIGSVVKLINDIAKQTNLLALNATIEAARAGDAGRGFVVVANEVKSLANQTGKATESISQYIENIRTVIGEAVQAIQAIAETISKVNEISTAISSAVEQQGAATQEIARNVEQAAVGTQEVSANICGVKNASAETGHHAEKVLTSAKELSLQSTSLSNAVEKFLSQIRL